MQIVTMGEYYVWYCEWCDSRNMTLWTRFDSKLIACSCCQREFENDSKSRQSKPFTRPTSHQQYISS
jgi:hypothetical protein